MKFVFGRENLALTIFVPFDCENTCPFCTSKRTYKINPPMVDRVKRTVQSFFKDYNFPIKDVVFTGGEPMANIRILSELVDMVPSKYNVYINTTFTNINLHQFVDLVNGVDKIKGVNISRHSETYLKDCEMFHDIAYDSKIKLIHKPVRINCVVGDQDIERVVYRWSNSNVELCFREDYTTNQNDKNHLHDPYGVVPMKLIQMGYRFHSRTQCNVCDTTRFTKNGNIVSFHKGKQHSSIRRGDELEINDLIITQDGGFTYDWSTDVTDSATTIRLLYEFVKLKPFTPPISPRPAYSYGTGESCGYSSCVSGCGARSEPVTYCGGYNGCGGRSGC